MVTIIDISALGVKEIACFTDQDGAAHNVKWIKISYIDDKKPYIYKNTIEIEFVYNK